MRDSYIALNPTTSGIKSSSFLDNVFIIFSLFFFALPQTTMGTSINQIVVNCIMLCITLLFTFPIISTMVRVIFTDKILLVFICYCFMSLLWSAVPIITLIFLLKIITATLFAYYIVLKYNAEVFFKYIIIFLMISAVLSFVLGILFPQYFIHQGINHTGEWKGIFGHKNALGTICAIGIFTTEIWFLTKKTNKVIAGLYFGLFSVLLFLSSSRTAIVVSLICLVIPIIYRVYKNLYNIHRSLFVSFIFFGTIGTAGTIYIVTSNLDFLFSLLDRTPTLTGRTEIWAVVREFIYERMWFGYGGGGFWYSSYALDVWNILNYPGLTSSHSGILDFLLDFGVIGLVIISVHYFCVLIRAVKLSFLKGGITIWFLVFVLFILINNYSDSRFLNTTSIFWVLYVCSSVFTKKQLGTSPQHNFTPL